MKKFLPYLKLTLLITNVLFFFIIVMSLIFYSNAISIINCRHAKVARFQIDPDYYYHGKEKGMNDAWYRVELSNGAKYKVNIQNYDTTYDFQFSEDKWNGGFHLTGFMYERYLKRLFKQNFEEYQKSLKIF